MEISENWLRSQTGWQPFKEGRAKAEQGLVTGFKQTGSIYQGVIRDGRLNLRPTVKVAGPTDVRVQCGCPENRATGGICSHAVAVLLTALRASAAESSKTSMPVAPLPPAAWEIRLSPRLQAELALDKLTVRLLRSNGPLIDIDKDLTSWLGSKKLLPEGESPLTLSLRGHETGEFLDLVAGHPRIGIEGQSGSFQLADEPGFPLRLEDSRLLGDHVQLVLSQTEQRRQLVRWGDAMAIVGPEGAYRLPGRSSRDEWASSVDSLARSARLKLPLETFLRSLDAWMDLFEPPHPGWLGSLRFASSEPSFELELEGSLEAVEAVLKVRYPGLVAMTIPALDEAIPGLPRLATDGHLLSRDLMAENRARRRLISSGFQSSSGHARFRLAGKEDILGFVADELPDLRSRWLVRVGDRLATVLKRVHVVRPEIQETANHGSSAEFELSFQTTGGKRIPSAEIRRILRGGKRNVRLSSGADLVVCRSCEEVVNPMVEEMGIGRPDETIRLSGAATILFRNLRENISSGLPRNDVGDSIGRGSETAPRIQVENLNARLRDYQAIGAAWMVDRLEHLGGVLLADEMGLGKTLQTIAVINHLKQVGDASGICLVIAPTSLLGNWMAELERFAPQLRCLLFHGTHRDALREAIQDQDVVVTSYGTLARDLAFHLKREYRLIVADEASLLRNPDAATSKSLAKLKGQGRVALTGTPVENRVQDLWSIFRFVAPGYLGERQDFKERYEEPSDPEAPSSSGRLKRLRLRTSPFLLRRTKEEVASDLPDKILVDEWLSLRGEQAELYASLARAGLEELDRVRERQGEGAGRMHLLTLLLRLRQVCVDPGLLDLDRSEELDAIKLERLFEILEERFESGAKTLVFSQFAKNLRKIEKKIGSRFGRVFCIDGSTRERQVLVDSFQSESGPAVFLISLKAGGYGLNLTAADAVIHLDPWWNPAVEAQATDRAHRIGQTRPVTVYRLLTRDTVEERVRRMQDRKRVLIDAATGADSDLAVPQNWTQKDLEELLR
ncbi:SNF2-related protein [Luteolibacter marinus]|uniref:SNF2-related protein n=1 Tax=Luteolibacter marinus TaxID=2776705 RepID=UPI00186923E7|nr:SNF2-related protein [Luteolibacter marinus]